MKGSNMKKTLITLLLPLSVSVTFAQTTKKAVPAKKPATTVKATAAAPKPVTFKNSLDSASYAFGLGMASNMKSGGISKLNYDLLIQGCKDAFAGVSPAIDRQMSEAAINNFISNITKEKYAPTLAEGKAFLENNKNQAGVQVTASGLQYQVINKGIGANPVATDTVTVHYRGTLLNGTEFDSSYKRNEPTTFPLNQVIQGWIEGLQLMQPGAKYRFVVPYNLAYGENGAGQDIPPYSTLIFEIELLKVNGK